MIVAIRHHQDDTEQLELVSETVLSEYDDLDDAEAVAAAMPAEIEVLPWKPAFDQTDDLDGLLEARGPLLARAFGGQGRQRPTT
jgi:hypothetical protein